MSEPQQVVPLPEWQQPSPRPTALTVIAIIGIVYGSLGLLCQGFGIFSAVAFGDAWQDRHVRTFQVISSAAAVILSIVLLLGSVGALYLKPVARKVLLIVAMIDLVYLLTRMIATITWTLPRTQFPATTAPPFNPATLKSIQVFSTIGMWLISSALPIAMLIILTRPRVRAAFDEPAARS